MTCKNCKRMREVLEDIIKNVSYSVAYQNFKDMFKEVKQALLAYEEERQS